MMMIVNDGNLQRQIAAISVMVSHNIVPFHMKTGRTAMFKLETCQGSQHPDFGWTKPLQWRHNERNVFQITSPMNVNPTVHSGTDQRKQQSSASLKGIYRLPTNSPHKGSVMRKFFPFDDVIMNPTLRNNTHIHHFVCHPNNKRGTSTVQHTINSLRPSDMPI